MKKILALALTLIMSMSTLAGCSSSSSTTTEATTTTTTEAATTETTTEATTEEVAETVWPERDVRLLVGFAAGGDIDVVTRYMAESVSKMSGKNFYVENMTGSNGVIAMEEIINSNDPDYEFFFINGAALAGNCVTGLTDYTYMDMQPVAIFGQASGESLCVSADLPVDTYEEFIEYAKENSLTMGVPLGGSLYAVAAAMNDYGLQLNVLDAGEAAERVVGLINGSYDCVIVNYVQAMDYIETGDVKCLATMCSSPLTIAPDLPCASTLIPEAKVDSTFVILANKDIDPAAVQAYVDLLEKCWEEDPDYSANIEGFSYQFSEPINTEDTMVMLEAQYQLFQGFDKFLN